MKTTAVSKRDSNKNRNEREILDVAINLFKQQGDALTTIRDIVQASSLARGTFYNYFKNKEEIWNKIIDELMYQLNENAFTERKHSKNIRQFIHDSFYPVLSIFNSVHYRTLIIKNPASFRDAFFRHKGINDIISIFESDMRESKLFEDFPEHYYKMTVYAMLGSTLEILIQTYLREEIYSVDQITDFITSLFENLVAES